MGQIRWLSLLVSAGVFLGTADALIWAHGPFEHGRLVDRPRTDTAASATAGVYSVQMHVHGSFSEGPGSMSLHTHEAFNAHVDVIWWSDHDFRTTFYHHVSKFSCDAWREPIAKGEPWSPNRVSEQRRNKGLVLATAAGFDVAQGSISTTRFHEGSGSLRLEGLSTQPDFQRYEYELIAENKRAMRTLAAQVSLGFAVYPEMTSADARPIVEITLSKHPANGVLAWSTYHLVYFLAPPAAVPYRDGSTYYVPLVYNSGQWNVYALPVTQHAVQGFPFIDGEDNALYEVYLGVESRLGGRAIAYFDAVHIEHVLQGEALFSKQRSMLDIMAGNVPEVVQLQGTEISYESPHLNEFTANTVLHDYDLLAQMSGDVGTNGWITNLAAYQAFVAQYVVDSVHARGGVVSYNHLFGTSNPAGTKEALRDELLANQVYGCDLLEVGYRDRAGHTLADYLWVWDELAKNGLCPVGTGVSDSHGYGEEDFWLNDTNNFVSWILAASPTPGDLIMGLKRGRVFFGDIALFDGHVELTTPHGFSMGQMVVTDKTQEDVTITIDGLRSGDMVKVIEAGFPTATYTAAGPTFTQTRTVAIDPINGTFVRVEVYDAAGCQKRIPSPACTCDGPPALDPVYRAVHCEKVFSNPIHFLAHVPTEGISPYRAAIDLGGVYSTLIEGFTLTDACLDCPPGSPVPTLTLSGRGQSGRIILNYAALGVPTSVQFIGLTGAWSYQNGLLTLDGLQGEGSLSMYVGEAPIPCADIAQFKATCVNHRLSVAVIMRDTSHDGDTVTVEAKGKPFTLIINGDRTRKNFKNRTGPQTIALTDPPGCRAPITVDCP